MRRSPERHIFEGLVIVLLAAILVTQLEINENLAALRQSTAQARQAAMKDLEDEVEER